MASVQDSLVRSNNWSIYLTGQDRLSWKYE
jgi:hypothetical protein